MLRLDISHLTCFDPLEEDGSPEILVETMLKIREFYTSKSSLLTTKLLHAKSPDGRPAFNFMNLRRLSMSFNDSEDNRSTRYLLQNAKLLENLRLSVRYGGSLVGLFSPQRTHCKIPSFVGVLMGWFRLSWRDLRGIGSDGGT